jgi:hypothetical protein
MNTESTGNSQLRRIGIGLIFGGFAIVPIGLILLIVFGGKLEDTAFAAAGLMVLTGGGLAGGLMVLSLDAPLRSRKSN